jgi:ADP-heptose:LPS heptosyltransferase
MKRSRADSPKRLLVVSTTGIGDTLMGTPALRALRESFPESEIHLLVNAKRKELVAKNPHVDRVMEYRNNPLHRMLLFFRNLPYEYDQVLVFHANEDIWPVLRGIRYGVCYNRQNFRNEEKRVFPLDSLPRHSVQRRLALVEKIGGKKTADYRYEFPLPADARNWASKKLREWGISPGDVVVGFQLGAADLFKCWPVENFAAVAEYLRSSRRAKLYVNVSPQETSLGQRFLELTGKEEIFLTPGGNLFQSAALIQRCNLFITPDTGPMHMAIGLGVPLIALFCPTSVEETGPLEYEEAVILKKERTCQPCLTRGCRDNFCMKQITVEEVCQAADRVLGALPPDPGGRNGG